MMPLVSILIPAYNAQEWIGDAIESALAQTWPRKEIIVVDDGSVDQTLTVARGFGSKNVVVVSQSNGGAAAARNKALSLCQGDYIQWLDADDLLSANKIAKQMDALGHAGSRMLASSAWGHFRYRPASATFEPTPLWESLEPMEWMIRKWKYNIHMQTATWLVSRELTDAAGPWDSRLLGDDDGEYFARVIKGANGITFVPDARVYYRISPASRLSYVGRSNAKMEAQFLGMELQIGYLRSMGDNERVRKTCIAYLQTWLGAFHPHRPDIVERARQLAFSLGGELHTPELSWKYAWIGSLFGSTTATTVQRRYNELKASMLGRWDKTLFYISQGKIDVSEL